MWPSNIQPFCNLCFLVGKRLEIDVVLKSRDLSWHSQLAVFQGCVPPDRFGLVLECRNTWNKEAAYFQ